MEKSRQPLEVSIIFDRIHCITEGDGSGLAEPYLWTLFFKIDVTTVQLDKFSTPESPFNIGLHGNVTIDRRNGGHSNLRNMDDDPVDEGDSVAIPVGIGKWDTVLLPIPVTEEAQPFIKDIVDLPATIGVLCILMEEDNLSDSSAVAGYNALCTTFESNMNERIKTMTAAFLQTTQTEEGKLENVAFLQGLRDAISKEIKSAILNDLNILEKTLNFLLGADDMLGSGVFIFDSDNLVTENQIALESRWKEGVNVGHKVYSVSKVTPDLDVIIVGIDILEELYISGPGNFITSGGEWQIFGNIFIKAEPIITPAKPKTSFIYAITPTVEAQVHITGGTTPAHGGDLLWGNHIGRENGSFLWHPGPLKKVGVGWGELTHVFSGGNGIIYAITPTVEAQVHVTGGTTPASGGDLMWGRHIGQLDGSFRWEGSLKRVGIGWGEMTHVFSGGNGIIYAITPTVEAQVHATGGTSPASGGDLMWGRHIGQQDGSFRWEGALKRVGIGWGEMTHVFSGGNGIIYAITPAVEAQVHATGGTSHASGGDLMWGRHIGHTDGSFRWEGAMKKIGIGWGEMSHVFSDGDGIIYAVTPLVEAQVHATGGTTPASGGDLMWGRHIGQEDGSFRWEGKLKKVGNGWGEMTHIFSSGI